jgi:hypothetical protein
MGATFTVTVEAKVLGQSSHAPSVRQLDLSSLGDTLQSSPFLLRTLLTSLVESEVHAFAARQEQRALLHFMTDEQISEGIARGKVVPHGEAPQSVDLHDAVAAAMQAFEDRLYLVLVDGESIDSLDDAVELHNDSRITLVRLVALIGG